MDLDKAALDRYITREPYWMEEDEHPALRCAHCGRFLKQEPDGTREAVSLRHCTGEGRIIECVYDEEMDASLLAIIGRDKAGTTYQVAYPPECGSKKISLHQTYDGDISPGQVEEYKHEPHFFVEDVWGYLRFEIRLCKCGHYNEEGVF